MERKYRKNKYVENICRKERMKKENKKEREERKA